MTEPADVVLARLDANVNNLITNVNEIKGNQANLVTRERLDIEVRAREADYARIQAQWDRAISDGQRMRDLYVSKIEALESAADSARGALRATISIGGLVLGVLGLLVGHLYIK